MTEWAGARRVVRLVDVRLFVDRNMSAQARQLTDDAVDDVGPELRYNLLLTVSELVANAVLHSRSPKQLRVLRDEDRLRVEVYDGNPELPVVLSPSPDRTHGRGMLLVDAFATEWGVETLPTGKVVWAELRPEP